MTRKDSSNAGGASHPLDIPLKPEFANAFWKMLIKIKGVREALAELHKMMKVRPEMLLQTAEAMDASESNDTSLKALEIADALWKKLVKAVGGRQAKQIMHFVMDEKKGGRPGDPMLVLIYCYIRACGPNESDEKIAKSIIKSKPYYVKCESGECGVVNDWMTEERHFGDETIVKRTPINKGLPAMKKHVGRVRRWLIEEEILPKEYAPRPYYRD
jgi:hypothetical protein